MVRDRSQHRPSQVDASVVNQVGRQQDCIELLRGAQVLDAGYYTSAVFFPVTARGNAGLRIMLRSDNNPDDIRRFAEIMDELVPLESPALAGVSAYLPPGPWPG